MADFRTATVPARLDGLRAPDTAGTRELNAALRDVRAALDGGQDSASISPAAHLDLSQVLAADPGRPVVFTAR